MNKAKSVKFSKKVKDKLKNIHINVTQEQIHTLNGIKI